MEVRRVYSKVHIHFGAPAALVVDKRGAVALACGKSGFFSRTNFDFESTESQSTLCGFDLSVEHAEVIWRQGMDTNALWSLVEEQLALVEAMPKEVAYEAVFLRGVPSFGEVVENMSRSLRLREFGDPAWKNVSDVAVTFDAEIDGSSVNVFVSPMSDSQVMEQLFRSSQAASSEDYRVNIPPSSLAVLVKTRGMKELSDEPGNGIAQSVLQDLGVFDRMAELIYGKLAELSILSSVEAEDH